jgi:Deacetylases, including yeast histone deacetylase and acetoin utilization protein
VEDFSPDWVLVSAGYDAHRADPLTDLGLSAGDFADIARRVARYAPAPGRLILFLEGGYDLDALTASVGASLAGVLEHPFRPEPATAGGPGAAVVEAAIRQRQALG